MRKTRMKPPETDEEALTMLYPGTQPKSWPVLLQKDFGTGESTTRAALKRGIRVEVPLRAILPFVDLKALRASRARRKVDG